MLYNIGVIKIKKNMKENYLKMSTNEIEQLKVSLKLIVEDDEALQYLNESLSNTLKDKIIKASYNVMVKKQMNEKE